MAALTLAEKRTLAWRTLTCRSCEQTPGHRCRNAVGLPTTPHLARMDAIEGWLARQPEVDSANAETASEQTLFQAESARADAADEAAAVQRQLAENARTQLTSCQANAAALSLQVTNLTKQLGDVRAQLEACEQTPDTPPATRKTQFGACILSGGAASVPSKYGVGASVRQFQDSPAATTGPNGSLMHLSVKTYTTDTAATAWLKSGGIRTFKHEPDNDKMTPTQINAWKVTNNELYDLNESLGRPCLIAPTFTGDFWSNHHDDAYRDVWLSGLKGHLFGLDFDGVHTDSKTRPADLVYRVGSKEITCADEIEAIQRALKKYAANGWIGFTVPEFGTQRAVWDTTGEGRTKWMKDNAKRFIDAGAYAVQWFDQSANGKTDVITAGSAEHTALKALVAGNK